MCVLLCVHKYVVRAKRGEKPDKERKNIIKERVFFCETSLGNLNKGGHLRGFAS